MKKRLFALTLGILLALSLSACGSESNENGSTDQQTAEEPPASTGNVVFDFTTFTDADWGEVNIEGLEPKFGELLSVTYSEGNVVVVKTKIESSYSSKATIDQNYYIVCNLIRDHGFNTADELQYWAVADSTTGDEIKVVSFTVEKDTLDLIASQEFADNTLGDYVADLWILPSLQN
ncbi:MAG: hypothetical protein MR419_00580 [Clostridiales bacterium]|nr:hypothetical protein [Clostridiales bacterium]